MLYDYPTLASYTLTSSFFFFNDTATTEIYTLSLHDALPISYYTTTVELKNGISVCLGTMNGAGTIANTAPVGGSPVTVRDRKSTRLNSSHGYISYAVFCLKKKKKKQTCTRLGAGRTS